MESRDFTIVFSADVSVPVMSIPASEILWFLELTRLYARDTVLATLSENFTAVLTVMPVELRRVDIVEA